MLATELLDVQKQLSSDEELETTKNMLFRMFQNEQ
jgi:hypothetical protein